MEDHAEPVKVFVRIRPEFEESAAKSSKQPNSLNLLQKQSCVALTDDKTLRITPPDNTGPRKTVAAVDDKSYSFDRIFPDQSTQEEVYQEVSSLVKATVKGYNTTVFAYGSTGSGKSYTMTGNSAAPGIIPRAISEIFSIIESTAAQENDVFFYVRISYVELYNNNFRNLLDFASKELGKSVLDGNDDPYDLSFSASNSHFSTTLNSNTGGKSGPPGPPGSPGSSRRSEKIEVRESQSTGVFLAGSNLRIPVTSAQEAFHLIAKGNKLRAVGSTQCNDVSSRYCGLCF